MELNNEKKENGWKKGAEKRSKEIYDKTHKEINGVLYKQCNHHKEFFPNEDEWLPCTEEYFYKNKSNNEGLNPYCKRCTVMKSTKWKNENPDRYKKNMKKCVAQPERTRLNRIAAKEQRENGYQKQYQQNNREKIRQYSRKREQKNHKINKKEWKSCLEYFNNCCAYCGITIEQHKKLYNQQLHKEHVVYNGEDDLSNCVPSCKSCNSNKWEFNMEEWYRKQSFFSEERLNKINKWINEDYKKYYIEKPKLPYKIVRKRNDDKKTFHYELWELNDEQELIECKIIKDKRKELDQYINLYFNKNKVNI